ncbi:uroporphyrinogen decarboxylase [Alphaproteobacteria bacterium]|nr:uroporphyrinogen decarboxylase [Alphaproteobacteria bacterium]
MNDILSKFFTKKHTRIPIWFLRQAGRHIPEYFEIRKKADNFIEFCLNTELIVQSTKLPLKYYDIDAAIVFSDILMIPWAMNRKVSFIKGIGPSLQPMIPNQTKVLKNVNIFQKLEPLGTSVATLRAELPQSKSLIGFAGAPWTLACYMIEGQSSKDFLNTRKALWNSNKWFMELLDTLSIYVADKLEMQAKAGADVLMLFDSWSHMIPNCFFKECAIHPTAKIISILRSKNITKPIIGFPFKAGSSLIDYSYESNVDCVALDWTVNLNWVKKNLNSKIAIQGNLDPASLIPFNSCYLENIVLSILEIMKDDRFIFSVGHGLTPDCKIKNVRKVIDIVRNYK